MNTALFWKLCENGGFQRVSHFEPDGSTFQLEAGRPVYTVHTPADATSLILCSDLVAHTICWNMSLAGHSPDQFQPLEHSASWALQNPACYTVEKDHVGRWIAKALDGSLLTLTLGKQKEWPSWVSKVRDGNIAKFRKFKPIIPALLPLAPQPGGVRVLKIHNRFARVPAAQKSWPVVAGYTRINVCKNNKYQDLSPMRLGPVYDENGLLYALNIEDGWQCSKVWAYQLQGHPPDCDAWLPAWEEWSLRGRFSGQAKRHRASKHDSQHDTNANIPLFSFYMGERLPYLQARKRMYMTWYQQLAPRTAAFKDLLTRHLSGENLLLLEYDGLDRNNPDENRDLSPEMLRALLDDDSRPFGHALVLACLLLGFHLWLDT